MASSGNNNREIQLIIDVIDCKMLKGKYRDRKRGLPGQKRPLLPSKTIQPPIITSSSIPKTKSSLIS